MLFVHNCVQIEREIKEGREREREGKKIKDFIVCSRSVHKNFQSYIAQVHKAFNEIGIDFSKCQIILCFHFNLLS